MPGKSPAVTRALSDLVDEELAERRDELSALIVVVHDILSAVQQPLCCSPGGTDVTGCFVELCLDVIGS